MAVSAQAQIDEPMEVRYCHHASHEVSHQHASDQAHVRFATNGRSDTFDILHTNINLEVIDFSGKKINGYCEIEFTPKVADITVFPLDLEALTIDSVWFDGVSATYSYDNLLLEIDLPQAVAVAETASVRVYYRGTPTFDPSGFGGFKFENGYAYNLGIGLSSNPYNFGRSWFPCFDNFVERSTYEFHIQSSQGRKGYAVGTFLGESVVSGDTILRSYEMLQPIPTYLVGVAVSNYVESNTIHEAVSGDIPLLLVAQQGDLTNMMNTFTDLGNAVDAIESWYGPYQWERVGYVTTTAGAMEHPTLIAYPEFVSIGGNNTGHKRLMAHELAHCWWGDIVTMSTPSDMWFKEGNAEYGAHLFTEYLDGEEAFIKTVKSNYLNVITSAHLDDGAYLPLSGIPFENTYGTHTYNKGASMIHNLRGYMGDELFSSSMTDILNHFAYQSIDAAQFRDRLSETSGIDLTSYFEDWIYTPGFAGFEINEMDITPNVNSAVTIEQKLRAKTQLHTNVPLEITFLAADGSLHTEQVMVSGALTEVQVNVPFAPTAAWLNGNHKLNIANFGDEHLFTEPSSKQFVYGSLLVNVTQMSEDVFLRVEHAWIAPDEATLGSPGSRISNSHYWKIDGTIPADFEATANFEYKGLQTPRLDMDLTANTEDSIVLVYRASATDEWVLFENSEKFPFSPSDGQGIIRANGLMLGEYAFANGEFPTMVNTNEPKEFSSLEVFPNPGDGLFFLNGELENQMELFCKVFDIKGQLLQEIPLGTQLGEWTAEIDLRSYAKGSYLIQLEDGKQTLRSSKKVVVQ